jgi:hypothetical protein
VIDATTFKAASGFQHRFDEYETMHAFRDTVQLSA